MNRREALRNTGLALGYSLSAGTIAAVMNGCKAPTETGWMPSAIDKSTIELIAELGETILPATDTPGAKDVLAHRFVDEVIAHAFGPNQKAHILSGLKNLSNDLGGSFMSLSTDDKLKAVLALEDKADSANEARREAMKAKEADKGDQEPVRAGPMERKEPESFRHYYSELKGLIMAGYFTSEQVGTEVLAYDPIPGDYNPCMEMTEGQMAWTH
tara:strand:+ start:1448 stop:2089 length:642 start_codon:yes stop_codon:yes gene_type:complete